MNTISFEVGSLDKYIKTVNSFNILSKEEEYFLASKFKKENDLNAAQQLISSQLRGVVYIADSYSGYNLPREDLIQEGNIGLMKAVKNYDPEHGVRLFSYAVHWVHAEIKEFIIRNWRLVKIASSKNQHKLFWNLRSLKSSLDSIKPKELSDIALSLNVNESDVSEMEKRLYHYHEMSIIQDENDEEQTHYHLKADSNYEPYHLLETSQIEKHTSAKFKNALNSLDERSRRIVESRWLNECSVLTLDDLSKEFGVSKERIRQIEVEAFKKMRKSWD